MQENLQRISDIKFDEKGLVPAIAQDAKSGEILMFAWMNKESLEETFKTNFAHYFSRSRQSLWKKGETSGNVQKIKEILIDCDSDCLILKIEQTGVACHTGTRTCFFRNLAKSTIVLSLLLFMSFSSESYAFKANKTENLTIFSEKGMEYPLVKIARLYSEQKNTVVSINFDQSSQLIRDIDDGEPADVFISSDPDLIETLKQKGLVDVYNLVNIAEDKLLLVASKNNKKINIEELKKLPKSHEILQILSNKRIPIIVDPEETSLGRASTKVLENSDIPSQRFFRRILEDRKSVAQIINDSNEYCGIVPDSALKNYENVEIIKEIEGGEVYYQGLVVAGFNMNKARDFLKFIKTDGAKEIFSEGGFLVN
ncbi:MAG: molybdenum ABC transporter molybdate-binding protein [Rickettsiales bacterium]|jgi:molybdenum ABC transporter molybdate-binding protein